MKTRNFTITKDNMSDVIPRIGEHLRSLELEKPVEVIVRDSKVGKTMAQLAGLFGNWVRYIADEIHQSGDKDGVEAELKARFLARIYIEEPLTPEQEMWVDLLAVYQISNEQEKLENHAKKIRLRWATLKQTKKYMDDIEVAYIAEGNPLPIMNKDWRLKNERIYCKTTK
ncbi:MAG: hypothetical protein JKY80_02050 [Mariprofundaceae bacterium]|nr:hypothetical protein [Mariprofundaceae bacterium]